MPPVMPAFPQQLLACFLQNPPVGLSSLKGYLRESTHGPASVVKVVLADIHNCYPLCNVFKCGGVGEWRAEQLRYAFHSLGLLSKYIYTKDLY